MTDPSREQIEQAYIDGSVEGSPIDHDGNLAMTTRAKVAAILSNIHSGTPVPGEGGCSPCPACEVAVNLTPHWMALWAAAEAVSKTLEPSPNIVVLRDVLAALSAAAESEKDLRARRTMTLLEAAALLGTKETP